jgi:serine/threonine protein kinase
LDPIRDNVYRCKLDEPCAGLPLSLVVKKQKTGWQEQFNMEIEAYGTLQELQGTVIPRFYGQCTVNGVPALLLSDIGGRTLETLAQNDDVPVKSLKTLLARALSALSTHGAIYSDPRLDNFLLCDDKIMIVDLEGVKFLPQPWEVDVNSGNVGYLMSRFKYLRNPKRAPSPINFSFVDYGPEGIDAENMYATTQNVCLPNVMERQTSL